jgi:hypothetical protein
MAENKHNSTIQDSTFVEVKKNSESTTWYDAHILDINIKGGYVTVSFDAGGWEDRDVPSALVRKRPVLSSPIVSTFDPQVNDPIEVRIVAGNESPAGWALGRVKAIKATFYFIGFEGTTRDLIVEKDSIRPVFNNKDLLIDLSKCVRSTVPVDHELFEWTESEDAISCLKQVQDKSGLLHVGIISNKHNNQVNYDIVLVGDDNAIRRAKLLLSVHLKHQRDIQLFATRKDKKLKILQERKNKFEVLDSVEFNVDESLVGLIIGKGGENIQRVCKKFNVDVRVVDPTTGDDDEADTNTTPSTERKAGNSKSKGKGKGMRIVRIFGSSMTAVEAARAELEYSNYEYKLTDNRAIGWVLGKKMTNIQEVSKKAGLHYARFNQDKMVIDLCGTTQSVDDAIMLLDSHMQYYDVYKDMDKEHLEMSRNFEAFDSGARNYGSYRDREDGGKGKGKGGKGKGVSRQAGNSRQKENYGKTNTGTDTASTTPAQKSQETFPDLSKTGEKTKRQNNRNRTPQVAAPIVL